MIAEDRKGLLFLFATWGVFLASLCARAFFWSAEGIVSGVRTVWSDWAVHLIYANVFAFRPPSDWLAVSPIFAGLPSRYPFAANVIPGLLMRLGVDVVWAFQIPSLLTVFFFLYGLYRFNRELLRTPTEANFAISLVLLSGGLGFLFFLRDLAAGAGWGPLWAPPVEYTFLPEENIEWINVVLSELLPQRALLLGMPLALLWLARAWRESTRGFVGRSPLALVGFGALAGLIPLVHAHSFLALVILTGCLFVSRLDEWRAFGWIAAGVFPVAFFVHSVFLAGAGGNFLAWQIGWMANATGKPVNAVFFWWLNWGFFLPVAGLAAWRTGLYRHPFVVGGAVIFLICNLVRLQPNPWDNTKLLTWSYLLLAIPVARYAMGRLADRDWRVRALTLGLVVGMTASGALELIRLNRTDRQRALMWSNEEVRLARALRAISRPSDVVLASDHHHQWVASLGGRQVLLAYRGWVGSYGIDYATREADLKEMLQGGRRALSLMESYGVRFVAIGPEERGAYQANEAFFRERYPLVLQGGEHRVYRVAETGARP